MKRARAFTLIEVLVALAIFAIMAVLSYRALASVIDSREQLDKETRKWRDAALFFARIEQDLQGLLNRPVRSADDTQSAPIAVNPDVTADGLLTFTRSGYAQAAGLLAAPQRIGYRMKDGRIELLLWPHPDAAPRTVPQVFGVLSGVSAFTVRALDARGNWQERWPAPGTGGSTSAGAGAASGEFSPLLVELDVTLKSGETLTRLFAMRGAL
jgi:general secretion pathway protein J